MRRKRKTIVIGAGPAGCAAALALSSSATGERGECVLLERKSLPRTKACGSGLSPWTLTFLDRLGVGEKVRRRAFRIDGAIIAGVDGRGVELRGDHETAVLLRSEFDELLAREAQSRGAELREGHTVRRIEGHRGQLAVETNEGILEADAVVDCSGSTGGFDRERRRKDTVGESTLHTIMGWYEGLQGTSDVVELFFDRELKPHYGWVFPETSGRVNVGLCFAPDKTKPNARQRFEAFLERRLAQRLRGAQQLGSWIGHPVQVSSVPRQLSAPGVLRAGEAGWLADFATAEGIYHALVSGHLAGTHLAKLASDGWREDLDSSRYQTSVIKSLAPRMLGGRLLMSALKSPALDIALSFSSARATREVLKRAFSGLYHG
ncbi:MAG TPA: geranylgeranyl reductase family protein [Polyangiaceae bacterium]|nr:geranylgeranyl reductase family protein [Polyangiaceae bacterium]